MVSAVVNGHANDRGSARAASDATERADRT
jgi:hypothetical protein